MNSIQLFFTIIAFLIRLPLLILFSIIGVIAQSIVQLCSIINTFLISTMTISQVSYTDTKTEEVNEPSES